MFIEHEIQTLAPSLRFTLDEHVQLIRFALTRSKTKCNTLN